jgi:hypothetical protein
MRSAKHTGQFDKKARIKIEYTLVDSGFLMLQEIFLSVINAAFPFIHQYRIGNLAYSTVNTNFNKKTQKKGECSFVAIFNIYS